MTIKTKKILWIVLFCVAMLFVVTLIGRNLDEAISTLKYIDRYRSVFTQEDISHCHNYIAWEIASAIGLLFLSTFSSILFIHKMKALKALGENSPRE